MTINLPKDKLTDEEVEFLRLYCADNSHVGLTTDVFDLFNDVSDKFIISNVFELNKPYEEVASRLGFHRMTIIKRVKKIRKVIVEYMEAKHLL